jgi:hypothetical protein
MTILILGASDDEHAIHMHSHLCQNGADAVHVDCAWFPKQMTITFDPENGDGEIVVPDGRVVAFDAITSVFWRNYDGMMPANLPHADQNHIAENDSRSLFESMLIWLPARWVNNWHAVQLHQTKPVQLAMVAQLGIPIPRSVITNAPQPVLDFVGRNRNTIYKPVQGGAHTRRLTAAELRPENLQNLKLAPVTIQDEIPGTNIRAFVAGEQVVACEVATTAIDFRDDAAPDITPHALSSEQLERCRAIARTLGLLWTGIDFRLTPDGSYVFLEANPSPMFKGFERYAGLPLTELLASLLVDAPASGAARRN